MSELPGVHPPLLAVREAVGRALAEDLLPLGDITASLLPSGARTDARLVARAEGVLAGRACAAEAFGAVDPSVAVLWEVDDGSPVVPGRVLAAVRGPAASVLSAERTALNFLCHLSGVATLTRRFVDVVAAANPGDPDPRHPQDHSGPAAAREGRSAGRRRSEPPRQPVRRSAREGQPPRGHHDRQGGGHGERPMAGAAGGGRVRPTRAGARGRRVGCRPGPAGQHDPGAGRRLRGAGHGTRAALASSSRSRAVSRSRRRVPSPPPAPT